MSPLGKLLLSFCDENSCVDIDRLIYDGHCRVPYLSRAQIVDYAKAIGLCIKNDNRTIMGMQAVKV